MQNHISTALSISAHSTAALARFVHNGQAFCHHAAFIQFSRRQFRGHHLHFQNIYLLICLIYRVCSRFSIVFYALIIIYHAYSLHKQKTKSFFQLILKSEFLKQFPAHLKLRLWIWIFLLLTNSCHRC